MVFERWGSNSKKVPEMSGHVVELGPEDISTQEGARMRFERLSALQTPAEVERIKRGQMTPDDRKNEAMRTLEEAWDDFQRLSEH